MTDKAIRDGFAHLKDGRDYDNLYDAAMCRAEADWLVGINATRALTCKYNAQLSCGRVQTPTLAMIARREKISVISCLSPIMACRRKLLLPRLPYPGTTPLREAAAASTVNGWKNCSSRCPASLCR